MRTGFTAMIIACALAGCATQGSVSRATLNTRAGYTDKIDNIIVGIKIDSIPATFSEPFVSNFRTLLAQRRVSANVRAMSELDLDPLSQAEATKYHFAMLCIPTHIASNRTVVQSITMNCTLTDNRVNIVVMKADVSAYKGFGFGFGQNEAEHTTQELLAKMEQAGLLSAQQAAAQ